jgi:hypothetical protein
MGDVLLMRVTPRRAAALDAALRQACGGLAPHRVVQVARAGQVREPVRAAGLALDMEDERRHGTSRQGMMRGVSDEQTELVRAGFTEAGLRRAMCVDPGPVFCTAARLVMEPDGCEVAVQHMPDLEPATQGRTRFILPAPPGGGYVRSGELLAEDGTAIIYVDFSTRPVYLPDGGTLLIPMEIS